MDITDGTPERFRIGIEGFLKGEHVTYHDVTFQKEPKGPLVIASVSECTDHRNATPEEARSKIERSRLVLDALRELSPEFAAVAGESAHRYQFYGDLGKSGAILLATEEAGRFTWVG